MTRKTGMALRTVASLVLLVCLSGCSASVAERPPVRPMDLDPWEPFNRRMFWFNERVDGYVLEPVATGWDWIAPDPVQHSVSNFFDNLRFPIVAGNNLLQGKVKDGASDTARFLVNTTVGVAGFFDPAARWGLRRHNEDFGQTLGWWGLPSGPYLVLPLLGPSTLRDAAGLLGDYPLSVLPFFVDQYILLGGRIAETVNTRSLFLREIDDARESALDFYVFQRSAYTQRRHALVGDETEMTNQAEDELYYFEDTEEEP